MTQSTTLPPNGPPPSAGDDPMQRVELVISILLRVGVVVSLTLVVLGSIVSFVRHPGYAESATELPGLTRPTAEPMRSIGGVVVGLEEHRGQAIVTLGLLVLIATPMMRVGVSTVAFLLERDWVYTGITLGVFCLLMLSLVLGAAE
jgi:uncharacterized membrane protein